MFDKEIMKLIDFKKVQNLMHEGVQVFMVRMDGTLLELTESTDWKTMFFHNIKGGSYAIYRKRYAGKFHKEIRIGKKVFAVDIAKKGGDFEWKLAFYKDNQ